MNRKKVDVDRFDDRLTAAYSNDVDKEKQYDEWAATYESDLVNDLGYVAHLQASDIFISHVSDRDARILDVACGTGLVGQYLHSKGYRHIDGVDLSTEMLSIARERGVYETLWQQDFTRHAALEAPYDALICVGMFAYAMPKISDMHNVVDCVKPGCRCVITVNGAAWRDLDLENEVHAEMDRFGYTIVEISTAGYIENQGIDSRVLVIDR